MESDEIEKVIYICNMQNSLIKVILFKTVAFFLIVLGSKTVMLSQNYWQQPVMIRDGVTKGKAAPGRSDINKINGYPAIAFHDETHQNLMFIIAKDSFGKKWEQEILVDTFGEVGVYLSLCEIFGKPAIAYYDYTNRFLKYIVSKDKNGKKWNSPVLIDTGLNAGLDFVLKSVNGYPAIAYNSSKNDKVFYKTSSDSFGKKWNASVKIVNSSSIFSVQLNEIDGKPAIVYGDKYINYVRALSSDGNTWPKPSLIDSATVSIHTISFNLINGKPAISFVASPGGYGSYRGLYFKTGVDNLGANWNLKIVADYISNANKTDLIEINGNPLILVVGGGGVIYTKSKDSKGNSWEKTTGLNYPYPTKYFTGKNINNRICISAGFYSSTCSFISTKDTKGDSWNIPINFLGEGRSGCNPLTKSIKGRPFMVYYHDKSNEVRCISAVDSFGQNWNKSVLIDSHAYSAMCFELIMGKPAIVYLKDNTHNIMLSFALDSVGKTWSKPKIIIDSFGQFLSSISIQQIKNGFGISYTDTRAKQLKFKYFPDTSLKLANATIVLDQSISSNFNAHLQIHYGKPIISYYNSQNKSLTLIQASDTIGAKWNKRFIIDSTDNSGGNQQMVIMNSHPAICFSSNKKRGLFFIRCLNDSGTNWSKPVKIDTNRNSFSFKLIDGYPAVTYFGEGNLEILYTKANNKLGESWGKPIKVTNFKYYQYQPSLCEIGKYAGITFHSYSEGFAFFVAGKNCISATNPTIESNQGTACNNSTIKLKVKSGQLNDCTNWTWFKNSCGSTPINIGDSLIDTLKNTTTYFARGQGGCGLVGNCGQTTIKEIPKSYGTKTLSVCKFYTTSSGRILKTTGNYKDTIRNFRGCDSIMSLSLFVKQPSNSSISKNTCGVYTDQKGNKITTSGIYFDTLLNYLGCDSVVEINLTINNKPDNTVIQNGTTLTAKESGAKYQWFDCKIKTNINGETSQSFKITKNGKYGLIISNNNCTDTSKCIDILSVNTNSFLNNDLNLIIPNPNNGKFEIKTNTKIESIQILNVNQKVIKSINLQNISNYKMDLSELSSGL